ncbi:MAG TPA: RNA-binding S4 domain-containing protein [Devosia sp.]|nr:RNA-binding S4 domain-containing protein [Devosia sp.]
MAISPDGENADSPASTSQRLDKWLWFARVVKTRTLAQKLIRSGNVRVDGKRVTRVSFAVGPGMVLTIAYAERIIILRVNAAGTRRGPAPQARTLYKDLSPEIPERRLSASPAGKGARESGSGRPTKKQRRQTDHLLGRRDRAG